MVGDLEQGAGGCGAGAINLDRTTTGHREFIEEIISLALLKLTLISLAFFFSILVIWPTFQFPFGFMANREFCLHLP
jgi:hypothetical protein